MRGSSGKRAEGIWVTFYLMVACPSIHFVVSQVAADPKDERFHDVLATPLEAQMHAALHVTPLVLTSVFVAAYAPFSRSGPLSTLFRAIVGLTAGTLCLHALFVLFGAPLAIAWIKTASLSAYLSSLTFVPLACVLGRDTSAWIRIVSRSLPSDHGDLAAYLPAAGALVGAWVGAFPIPLDWDRPWQAWPITCAVGGTAGHMLGLAASLSVMTWTSLRSSKAKRD